MARPLFRNAPTLKGIAYDSIARLGVEPAVLERVFGKGAIRKPYSGPRRYLDLPPGSVAVGSDTTPSASSPCDIRLDPTKTLMAEIVASTDPAVAEVWSLAEFMAEPIVYDGHKPDAPIGIAHKAHWCGKGLHALIEFAPSRRGEASWQYCRSWPQCGWSVGFPKDGKGHEISFARWTPVDEGTKCLRVSQQPFYGPYEDAGEWINHKVFANQIVSAIKRRIA